MKSMLAEELREITSSAPASSGVTDGQRIKCLEDGNRIGLGWPGHDDGKSTYKCDARPQRPGALKVPTSPLGAERIGTVLVGTGRPLENTEFDQAPNADRQA